MQVPRSNQRTMRPSTACASTVEDGLNVLGDVAAHRARADVVGAAGYTLAAHGDGTPPALVDALVSVHYAGPELT